VSYLIDTNVASETVRPKPDREVLAWLDSVPDEALHLSVLSLGEIRYGVEKLKASPKKRERLRVWLEQELPDWFEGRILPVDSVVGDRWGRLLAEQRAKGKPLPAVDSLLAATALVHGFRLVTRNRKDFDVEGLEVVSPWSPRQ
jgi:predicted nucleic acid-binding protein